MSRDLRALRCQQTLIDGVLQAATVLIEDGVITDIVGFDDEPGGDDWGSAKLGSYYTDFYNGFEYWYDKMVEYTT